MGSERQRLFCSLCTYRRVAFLASLCVIADVGLRLWESLNAAPSISLQNGTLETNIWTVVARVSALISQRHFMPVRSCTSLLPDSRGAQERFSSAVLPGVRNKKCHPSWSQQLQSHGLLGLLARSLSGAISKLPGKCKRDPKLWSSGTIFIDLREILN